MVFCVLTRVAISTRKCLGTKVRSLERVSLVLILGSQAVAEYYGLLSYFAAKLSCDAESDRTAPAAGVFI